MNINQLAKLALQISRQRMRNGAKIDDDTLKAAAGEICEAFEARAFYNKARNAGKIDVKAKEHFAEELADVIICILITAAETGVNINDALQKKIMKNKKRAELKGDKK